MALVMVEQAFEGTDARDGVMDRAAKLEPCLAARTARHVETYVATDMSRTICVFDAPDAQSVRDAFRNAGVPCVRVWAVMKLSK